MGVNALASRSYLYSSNVIPGTEAKKRGAKMVWHFGVELRNPYRFRSTLNRGVKQTTLAAGGFLNGVGDGLR